MDNLLISSANQVPAYAMKQRIEHVRNVIAFINDSAPHHKDQEAFCTVVDYVLSQSQMSPVAMARAFEVNTATISRWRNGKNAPHPRERPAVIGWMKQEMHSLMQELCREAEKINEDMESASTAEGRVAASA